VNIKAMQDLLDKLSKGKGKHHNTVELKFKNDEFQPEKVRFLNESLINDDSPSVVHDALKMYNQKNETNATFAVVPTATGIQVFKLVGNAIRGPHGASSIAIVE
jgi:hypothetical protein